VRDWAAWHHAYENPASTLSRRLRAVQRRIGDALTACPPGPVRVISMCAGQGRDLLGVLADHPRAADVTARLVELDPDLAGYARESAPPGVEVVTGDGSRAAAYSALVPADLVLVCGVFGNMSDADVAHVVANLARFCRTGGTVVWTRHINAPDLTQDIRRWFDAAGFREVGFDTEPGASFGVGAHVLTGQTLPFDPDLTLFEFTDY
jgi:hypothetical protein